MATEALREITANEEIQFQIITAQKIEWIIIMKWLVQEMKG